MAIYTYQVGGSGGNILTGSVEAVDEKEAVDKLKNQGYFVLKLRRAGGGDLDIDNFKDAIFGRFKPEMSGLDRVMFTTNLAELLKTGLPIVEAIETFIEEGGSSKMRRMIQDVVSDIRAGQPPSKAFARFPRSFPPVYTAIVASGETIGTLGETLSYLGLQLKKEYDLKSKVRGAFTYPIVVIIVMIVVSVFILFFVVPKITAFAANLGTELPLATKILIGSSDFIVHNALALIVGAILAFVGISRAVRTDLGKRIFDRLSMKFPIVGPLIKKYNIAQFARLLGAFYHYGVSLPQAFEMLSNSMGNYYYRESTLRMKEKISRGLTLSEAINQEDRSLYPGIIVRMIRGAEKSAKVDEALWRFAEFYETDLENNLKNITTIIEPILIVVLGIGIVGLAVAVVVPIYKISTSFQ